MCSLNQRSTPDNTVRIRAANAAGVSSIVSVTNAAFAVETFLEGSRTDEERLTAMLRKGSILVAEDGPSHIVASVYVELRGARGYFGMLAVDPQQQGRNMGRTMVQAAEDYCRQAGCSAIDITVLSQRPELPPFYQRLGIISSFVRLGRITCNLVLNQIVTERLKGPRPQKRLGWRRRCLCPPRRG
jgi:predicted N-acetyltransferase YhbS